jgi:biofilm PGA synthesis N-glycosyltransferase PgaC
MSNSRYVLITCARNEEDFIENTLKSVVNQTVLPEKWIIVSDSSTDRTEEIVSDYAQNYDFIQLVSLDRTNQRSFGSKVSALNRGYEELQSIEYDYLGILDADISFDSYYYEKIFDRLKTNKKLGICGGIRFDLFRNKFVRNIGSQNSVGGGYQVYRRQCYEETGQFIPLEKGGEDYVKEIQARMFGWEVESFLDIEVYHHRPTGAATKNILTARFNNGVRDYLVGYHAIFEMARCFYRLVERPPFIGSLLSLIGYFWADFKSLESPVPKYVIAYLRREQIARLKSMLFLKSNKILTI